MDSANLVLAENLLSRTYVQQGQQALKQRQNLVKSLLSNRRMPDTGWDDASIELLLHDLSLMDSNNFLDNVGMGEREAKCASQLVLKRHYGMAHGIGRSGSLTDEQPKAGGSTILAKLCNALVKDALEVAGLKEIGAVAVLPMATGMTLMLALVALKKKRPKTARYVLWPRMDQKSCLKSIIAAGLEVVVIPNQLEGDQLRTDVDAIQAQIEELGSDQIICVLSTTSCFATRAPDRIVEIAKLCQQRGIGHVINNAYGVQCAVLCRSITQAWRRGRVDAVVQSTDKNFLVPVGGAVIAAGSRACSLVEAVNRLYPGRASLSPVLDVFITLLSLGAKGWKKVLADREVTYEYLKQRLTEVAEAQGERLLHTPDNPISLALTLDTLESAQPSSRQAAHTRTDRADPAPASRGQTASELHSEEETDVDRVNPEQKSESSRSSEHTQRATRSDSTARVSTSSDLPLGAAECGGAEAGQSAGALQKYDGASAESSVHVPGLSGSNAGSSGSGSDGSTGEQDAPPIVRDVQGGAASQAGSGSHDSSAARMGKTSSAQLTFFGSMLFARCVSGSRVIAKGEDKVIEGIHFAGYGSSYDSFPHSYMTAAAAVGATCAEVDVFITRLDCCFTDFRKKQSCKKR